MAADTNEARALAYARVNAYWERLIRPSLREQADRMTPRLGRRPTPGELLVLVGPTEELRALLRPGVVGEAPGGPVACVVVARDRVRALMVRGPTALVLEAILRGVEATALPVVWFDGPAVDVVPLHDVIDTGPEGAAINSPGGRLPS